MFSEVPYIDLSQFRIYCYVNIFFYIGEHRLTRRKRILYYINIIYIFHSIFKLYKLIL